MNNLKAITFEIIRYSLIALFFYTAVSKIVTFKQFANVISSQPVGAFAPGLVAMTVIGLELLIVILLVLPKQQKKGLYLSTGLMIIFTAYVGLILANAFDKIPCYCGGVLSHMQWPQHLIFNIVFTILSITALVIYFTLPTKLPSKF